MSTANTTSGRNAGHWIEYLAEALGLGLFMVSACGFATLLEHPASRLHQAVPDPFTRRAWMGLAMGLTAVGLIYSPWGRRSGAHLNPAVTWTFHRLGRVATVDAFAYTLFQFMGGIGGVVVSALILGPFLGHPAVAYVVTVPGPSGVLFALAAEAVISFLLMLGVLVFSSSPKSERFTGWLAGICVGLFIAFEAPFSGMSINPARTVASALVAHDWRALWIYLVAPPLGMLGAAAVFGSIRRFRSAGCAKLHHDPRARCIFCEHRRRRPMPDRLAVNPELPQS